MKHFLLLVLALSASSHSFAHTFGKVKFTCPLDKARFESMQDLSGTSFGLRLDLKQVGPIAQPWALAQCPKCKLVLFKEEWTKGEVEKLREIVASDVYAEAAKTGPSYLCLAVLKSALGDAPEDIGWSYLQASWQIEEEPSEKELHRKCLRNALGQITQAVRGLKEKGVNDEYLVNLYLQIELHRRLGEFDRARALIKSFPAHDKTEMEWLDDALKQQRGLCKAQDARIQDMKSNEE